MSLDHLMEHAVSTAGLPGIAVEVSDGAGTWCGAAGLADTATGRPRHSDDRFRIGSITKTFVATVLLQLTGELDEPVSRRLPGLLTNDAITVRQLLNHTSGLFNYTLDQEAVNRHERLTPEVLVRIATDRPPLFAPGTGWSYSNTNYVVAGLLVERITGRPLADEIDDRICRPLGLTGTRLPTGADHGIRGQHARHYTRLIGAGTLDATEFDPALFGAAGAMISTTGDLGRFFRALLGGELLPTARQDELVRTVPAVDWLATGAYGLGVSALELPCGDRAWGMGGATFGSTTFAYGSRDGGRMLVANINGDWSDPIGILTGLLHATLCPAGRARPGAC